MSVFALISLIWRFLPSFIGLAETLSKLIQQGKADYEIKQRMEIFHKAAIQTSESHDTRALEDLFNDPKKTGIVSPAFAPGVRQ